MELASLILSIASVVIGIIGIIVSILLWKYNYNYIKIIYELNTLDFSEEYSISKCMNIVTKAKHYNIDLQEYLQSKSSKDSSLTKSNLMNTLYNMSKNISEKKG